jgi:hypothetical protein
VAKVSSGETALKLGEREKFAVASHNFGETYFENLFMPARRSQLFLAAHLVGFKCSNHSANFAENAIVEMRRQGEFVSSTIEKPVK